MNNMREDAITGHGAGCKPVLRLCVSIWIYVGGLLFSFFFFLKKRGQKLMADNKVHPPCGQFLCSSTHQSQCLWVVTLWQVKCIWYVQYRIMIGVRKGKSSIWQAVSSSPWKKKTNLLFLSIVRGSMAWGNLHHKNSHNIENYLQWEKKMFFFFSFSWVLVPLCELSVWMNQSVPNVFFLILFFFSCGNSWKCMTGPSVSSAVCLSEGHRELCFLVMSKNLNDKDDIHTVLRTSSHLLNPSLFSFFFVLCFFFVALLKGSFPTAVLLVYNLISSINLDKLLAFSQFFSFFFFKKIFTKLSEQTNQNNKMFNIKWKLVEDWKKCVAGHF